jgi:prophage tail gpP-like protein
MTAVDNAVTLRVNGTEYGGWKEVEIGAGIERQARDFSLAVTTSWPGETNIPRRIRHGDLCEVWIGADKLLTGHVDATPISYDAMQVSVGVRGRSKTADLVDCSAEHKTGQWRGAKIERIAADLARPYGISVVAQAATGAPIADHQIQPGETAFECIDRLLTLRQLLATDDADGRLVFIAAGEDGRCATALKLGENVKSADAPLDFKDVFSQYTVKGQRSGSDEDSGATVAEATSTAKDSKAARYRPLVIRQSGQVDRGMAADRARYEYLHRKAKALEAVYTVQGWRQQDGSLWLPNRMVQVIDPVIGFDVWMLIVEVTWKISDGGTETVLRVGPVDGYIPTPEAAKKGKGATGDPWAGVAAAAS